jgi:agmatinase
MNNFLSLPEEYRTEKSAFRIIPIQYEGSVSWMKGAAKGASAIIRASSNMEYYDEQFKTEPFLSGIKTENALSIKNMKEDAAVKKISEHASLFFKKGIFPVFLGGDHSVTSGIVSALEKKENSSKFSYIVFDAHSDLRESWNGSRFNHACTTKRICEQHNCLIVGLRSQDIDEHEFAEKEKKIRVISALGYSIKALEKEISKLKEDDVYLSIDADVFDPSFIRSTGTPEPGGLYWNDVIAALEMIFEKKNVLGMDIVEFSPAGSERNYNCEAFSLAKLCYKAMAMKEESDEKKKN